jgi:stage V sporulation protein G
VVHDIKVIQGAEKLFIAMPSRKVEDGTYKDITHPIKSGFRIKIQEAVMARYEQALNETHALAKGSEKNAGEETE